jgi:ABC-type glycerol-3-phosphate transport system substrate-binding protein
MKQMYRMICAVLCVVLCLGLMAGCSSSKKTAAASGSTAASTTAASTSTSSAAASSDGDVTLTVWFSDVQSDESTDDNKSVSEDKWNINVYARKFEEENPGVKIKVVYQADQSVAQNKLKAAVAANTAPGHRQHLLRLPRHLL